MSSTLYLVPRSGVSWGSANASELQKELRRTAYHEAGHTLVSLLTPNCSPIHKVTIEARGSALGHVSKVFRMNGVEGCCTYFIFFFFLCVCVCVFFFCFVFSTSHCSPICVSFSPQTASLFDEEILQTKAALRATLDSCFGGQVAEEIIYGTDEVSTGCSSDLEVI